MKPRDLAAAVRKRGWMIVAIIILAALIATLAARIQKPSYKAEITVSTIAPTDAYGQPNPTIAGIYVMIMSSISNAMEGYDVAVEVHNRLLANGIDISPEELLTKAKAESEVQTSYATLTITDTSPTRVAEIANVWGEVLEKLTGDDKTVSSPTFKELLLGGKLMVTNQAVPPKKPNQPKPMVYLGLGLFLGLVLGLSTAIGIEYFDPHFRSAQEVEETLEVPVMGTVTKLKGAEATTLLSSRKERTPAQDAYSQLRTTLMFSLKERPSKSILVIPAIPTEDAPYITANLAISIAHTDRKTLVIDCDLREQSLSKIMNASQNKGLSEALARTERLQSLITETGTPNLYLLPAGKASDHSSDLLSMTLLDDYLRQLESWFDELIIHAPALTSAIDGVIVASKANLSLVVIDVQKCSRNVVLEALESFNLLHIVPTGVVLSNMKLSRRERALRAGIAAAALEKREAEAAPVAAAGPSRPSKPREAKRKREKAAEERAAARRARKAEAKAAAEPKVAAPERPAEVSPPPEMIYPPAGEAEEEAIEIWEEPPAAEEAKAAVEVTPEAPERPAEVSPPPEMIYPPAGEAEEEAIEIWEESPAAEEAKAAVEVTPEAPERPAEVSPPPEKQPLAEEGKAEDVAAGVVGFAVPTPEREETPAEPERKVRPAVEKRAFFSRKKVERLTPRVSEKRTEQERKAGKEASGLERRPEAPGVRRPPVRRPEVTAVPEEQAAPEARAVEEAWAVPEEQAALEEQAVLRAQAEAEAQAVKEIQAAPELQEVAEAQAAPGAQASPKGEERIIPPSEEAGPDAGIERKEAPLEETAEKRDEEALSIISPAAISMDKSEKERGQLKEALVEDFRRLGAAGSPIPKDWLKALNAEKEGVRELATMAVKSYYLAFLRKYGISDSNIKNITESIIMMMRREGRFASMNEREAQRYLQNMLTEAGAKFHGAPKPGSGASEPQAGASGKKSKGFAAKNKRAAKDRKRRGS